MLGTQLSEIAIPVIAVLLLRVSPFEVALLGTFQFLPFLLFTLPAGVWVDRLPRRLILVSGDLGRGLLLATIPVAYALGALTIWQLYTVAFANGVLTVFFDIADQSYLPTVVERDRLVDGNAKLQASASAALVVGQPLGGSIVALLSAPFALVLDAISYVASALLIFTIRRPEPAAGGAPAGGGGTAPGGLAAAELADAPSIGASVAAETAASNAASGPPGQVRESLRAEVAEGLRFVLRHRYLRSIAATTGSSNLFGNIAFAILPVFFYRDLTLTPEVVGLIGGGFGAGALAGALTASRIAERLGIGPTIIGSIATAAVAGLLVPLASHQTALLFIGGGGFVAGWANVVYNVNQISLRQSICPERMLGRMNATMRFIVWGTIPIGQVIGGLTATLFGTLAAVWIGTIGGLFAFLPVLLSPVRSLRTIPDPEPEPR